MDLTKLDAKQSLVVKMLEMQKVPLDGCMNCVFDLKGLDELGYDEALRIRHEILQVREQRLRQGLQDLNLDVATVEEKISQPLGASQCIQPEKFVELVAELLPDGVRPPEKWYGPHHG